MPTLWIKILLVIISVLLVGGLGLAYVYLLSHMQMNYENELRRVEENRNAHQRND